MGKSDPYIKWFLNKEKSQFSNTITNDRRVLLNCEIMNINSGGYSEDNCFECGSSKELHNHHIIPKSLGGKKTIRLCTKCHGIIHNLDFTNHSELVKLGVERARNNGIILGRSKGSTIAIDDFMDKHSKVVDSIKLGGSVRKTAKLCEVSQSTVQRVKKYLNLQ